MSSKKKIAAKIKTVARKSSDKAELRELILVCAREMVLQNGFANLSIRKLADKIGYAPGTIYLYFKNRDDLVREICLRGLAQLSEKMQSATDAINAQARLTALLRAYADFAMENSDTYRLSFMENPAFTHEMMRAAPLETEDGAGRRAFAQIVGTLQELKQNCQLAAGEDENLLAEMLWVAVHGIVSLKLIYPAFPTNSVETLIDKIIETMLTKTNSTE